MQSKLTDISHANCWAEINLTSLEHNVRALRTLGPEIMAILKADAYGHETDIITPKLAELGLKNYGVATASEGASLRELVGSDANVYVMTASSPGDARLIVRHDLTAFVSTQASIKHIGAAAVSNGTEANVHIEIDTGIGRAGISVDQFAELLPFAAETKGIKVTGLCTHFTSGEDKADALGQYRIFKNCLDSIPAALRETLTIHAANSPAMLNVVDAHFDLIRPGLLLYGIAPVAGMIPTLPDGVNLEPVLSLKAKVILVRDLPAGTPISYGRTFTLEHPAKIATVGIGYGDGYSRRLSNIGSVILPSGKLASIRGRVCMDQICVEVPDGEDLIEGDAVTLIGQVGKTQILAADIAGLIDATPHEITTCITRRVPRVVVS